MCCEINRHQILQEILHAQSFANRAHHAVNFFIFLLSSTLLSNVLQAFYPKYLAEDFFFRLCIKFAYLRIEQSYLHLNIFLNSSES
jgi:hypothetical protein